MISSRDLNDLHPAVKRRALAMISACDADGITLLITSTYRDNASQDKLYAQGRGGAVGPVVTNAKGGQSWHSEALAPLAGRFMKTSQWVFAVFPQR